MIFCFRRNSLYRYFRGFDRKLRVSRSWTMTVENRENLGRDLGWSKNVLPYSNWLLDGPDVAFATNFRAKWLHNFHRFLFFWYAIIRQKVIILVCYFTFLILEDFFSNTVCPTCCEIFQSSTKVRWRQVSLHIGNLIWY